MELDDLNDNKSVDVLVFTLLHETITKTDIRIDSSNKVLFNVNETDYAYESLSNFYIDELLELNSNNSIDEQQEWHFDAVITIPKVNKSGARKKKYGFYIQKQI